MFKHFKVHDLAAVTLLLQWFKKIVVRPSIFTKQFRHLLALLAVLTLTACGGGGGGGGGSSDSLVSPEVDQPEATMQIDGSVTKGLLRNALVEVYSLRGSTLLTSGRTDDVGQFNLEISEDDLLQAAGDNPLGVVLRVQVTGDAQTTMICDADCGDVAMGDPVAAPDLMLQGTAFARFTDASVTVHLNVFTTLMSAANEELGLVGNINIQDFEQRQKSTSDLLKSQLELLVDENLNLAVTVVPPANELDPLKHDKDTQLLSIVNASFADNSHAVGPAATIEIIRLALQKLVKDEMGAVEVDPAEFDSLMLPIKTAAGNVVTLVEASIGSALDTDLAGDLIAGISNDLQKSVLSDFVSGGDSTTPTPTPPPPTPGHVPADQIDWQWDEGGEPTFPNEAYGPEADVNPDEIGDNQLFDVWVPQGAGPFPVYVYAHGGGFTGGSKRRMVLSGPLLQNDNVVYVNINYRLHGGSLAGIADAVEDGVNLLEYLKTNKDKYKINPDQIFVGGASAGGVMMNDIAYNEKVSGIKGIWNWNLFKFQTVSLEDPVLLANVPVAVVNAHPDLYPSDNSHSALSAFNHSNANWLAGNTGTFFKATKEHPSAIGYEDPYVEIEQLWIDGTWELDSRDGTNTGVRMPNLAQWIYGIVTPPQTPINVNPTEHDVKVASINAGFNNVEMGIIEWPSDLLSQLGEIDEYAFLTRPKQNPGKLLPLIISLHGGGGTFQVLSLEEMLKLDVPRGWNLAELANENVMFLDPIIHEGWDPNNLNKLLDYVLKNFSDIDKERVYVMGYSRGGGGTYDWLIQSGDRFAAAAPCGFSSYSVNDDLTKLVNLPIWTAVGSEDNDSAQRATKVAAMVDELEAEGNENVDFTVYPGANHNAAGKAVYSAVELVDFLLGFKLP